MPYKRTCRVYTRPLDDGADLFRLTRTIAQRPRGVILGGNTGESHLNRFSYFACEPVETFEYHPSPVHPLEALGDTIDRFTLAEQHLCEGFEAHFYGGWIGFFSYDLKDHIEKLPARAADDLNLPLISLSFYDRLIIYDRDQNRWFLCVVVMQDRDRRAEKKFAELESLVRESRGVCVPDFDEGIPARVNLDAVNANMNRQFYLAAMDKIRGYIYDGDVYQINFSQRFDLPFTRRGIDLFLWQNAHNPSPYAAWIDGGDYQIVSASPEMFLTLRGGLLSTRPIKGTRPRILHGPGAETLNRRHIAALLADEKEKAELNMIIDLERNDLTRVCEYGTIRVVEPRTIEAYPTVFHALATVEARLRNPFGGRTLRDILRATFPGGSITGAPKIRAMEIIDELEPTRRAIYTGSIGYIGLNQNMCLNIAIRTIIIRNQRAYAQTGGGIVADSVPDAEWDETLTKARAMLAGIKAVQESREG